MQPSYIALLLAALSLECALASPTHQRLHAKHPRDLSSVDWKNPNNYAGVDWSKVNYGGGAPAAAAAPVAAVAPASPAVDAAPAKSPAAPKDKVADVKNAAPTTASSPAGSGGSKTSGFGGRTNPKNDGTPADRQGNIGIPYGSNMKLISVDEVKAYDYTNVISNVDQKPITVIVWNKFCADGSAGWTCPNLKVTIPVGGKQAIAFDEDSQGGFSLDCGTNDQQGGTPNCTWGEYDFCNQNNDGWSGYDRSSIPNTAGNVGTLTMSSAGGKTSSQDYNSFTSAAQSNAGGALGKGPAHMFTEIGN